MQWNDCVDHGSDLLKGRVMLEGVDVAMERLCELRQRLPPASPEAKPGDGWVGGTPVAKLGDNKT